MQKLLLFIVLVFSCTLIHSQDTTTVKTAKTYTDSAGRRYIIMNGGKRLYLGKTVSANDVTPYKYKELTLWDKAKIVFQTLYKNQPFFCWIIGIAILLWLLRMLGKLFG